MTEHLLITGARIIDVREGRDIGPHDVLIVEGQIARIDREIEEREVKTLRATGLYLLPGLIDAHVHVTAASANIAELPNWAPSYLGASAARIMTDMLQRGFTTVRDTGGADFGLHQAQSEGLITGPRLIFGGKAISQTGGHGDFRSPGTRFSNGQCCCGGEGLARLADGADAVRLAVRDELRKGAYHIKVMASGGVASPTDHVDSTQYSMDELRAAVEEAEAANRYVTAHAYTARAVNRALQAGVRSIEHGNLINDESISLLLEKQAYLVPTLVTYWALKEEGRQYGLSQASWEKVDSVLGAGLEALDRAAKAGVQVVFGTDLLGGMHRYQNEEFRIRSQVQSNAEILKSATITAASLIRMEKRVGEIAVDMAADLLLLDKNPLADIDSIAEPDKHLKCVIQGGRIVIDRRLAAGDYPAANLQVEVRSEK